MEHNHSTSMDEHAHHAQVQETSIEEMELRSWKRKMIWAWIFTIPIALVMLAERFLEFEPFPDTVMHILILIVAFPAVFIAGWQTIKGGVRGLYTFYFNMDSLIALGTVIAYLSGVSHIFFESGDFSGIAAMIMAIFITGKFIETKARGQATQEIRKLLELGAKKARILQGNKEIEIDIAELKIGAIMIIKPGEKIPTDGIVVKGESAVDESMISGESLPVDKTKGSPVIGATLNQDGVLYVKATKVGNDTFLAHIITLVEEAQGTKIPIQRLADKITNIFVPIILVLAL
jgi:Cu+-exporting ATPase